ncbi:MAG: hypothetical protein QOG34_2468 [Frankiaceae bacterium]|jgi:hypothetical protein|nr:hypothetical protein [Frankiaceae bacterium]
MPRRFAVVLLALAAWTALGMPDANASSTIQLGRIQYNAPGTDTTANTSVNGEYVVVKNLGTRSVSLTGWTLRDAQNHIYKFGTFSLGAGKAVVVHTGKGTNSSTLRYWGLGWHVWNNTGDTAYLRNAAGVLADKCAWTSNGSGYKYC